MVSLFLMLLLVPQDNAIIAKQAGKPNSFEAETPHGKALIEVTSPVIYIPKDGPEKLHSFFGMGLIKNGFSVPEAGNHFATQPKPTKYGYADSQEYKIDRKGTLTYLEFRKLGKTQFAIEFGETEIHVPLDVREVPFSKGINSDELISELGIPSGTHEFWIKWPSDRSVDTIFYTVSVQESIRQIEHWMFDKYPHCMFAIEGGKVIGIHSVFVDEDNKRYFKEKWKHPVKDAKEAEKAKADLKSMIDRLENEQRREDKPPAKTKDFETFTLIDGTGIYGVFVDYKNSKVILERDSGEKVQYPLTKFEARSIDRIRELFKNKSKKK